MRISKRQLRNIIAEHRRLLKEITTGKVEALSDAAWDIAAEMADAGHEWDSVRAYLMDEVAGVVDTLIEEEKELYGEASTEWGDTKELTPTETVADMTPETPTLPSS
jgi:hypothetical protein